MLSIPEYIAMRAPQWTTDPRLTALITHFSTRYSPTVFGIHYNEAVGLYVLHVLSLESRNGGNPGTGTTSGNGGASYVTAEREGDVSMEYDNPTLAVRQGTTTDLNLNSTSYGLELKTLIRMCIYHPITRLDDGTA
jgi:hypothetical protein